MDSTSAPVLINNTLTRNRCTNSSSSYSYGGGLLAIYGATAEGYNNIIYDNTCYNDPNVSGPVSFTYSCVQGGLPGAGNISDNPLFVHNPPAGYFMLGQTEAGQPRTSPCVDAGDPGSAMITGSTRTDLVQDSDIVDMGFHWWLSADEIDRLNLSFFGESESTESLQKSQQPLNGNLWVGIQPNPFNASTVISYKLQVASHVNISVYDVAGRMVSRFVNGWRNAGKHEVTWNAADLPSGVYFVRLEAGEFAVVKKVVSLQ